MSLQLDLWSVDYQLNIHVQPKERYSNSMSMLRHKRDGVMSGNVFRSLSSESHVYGNGWKAMPIKVGDQTIFGVFEMDRHLRFDKFQLAAFAIEEIEGRICLTLRRKDKCVIIEEFNNDSIKKSLQRVASEGYIESLHGYRYCATDAFDLFPFHDVFKSSLTNRIRTVGFKALPIDLTDEFQQIVKEHIIGERYRLELVGDPHGVMRLLVKYELIIGGFTVAFIDGHSIPDDIRQLIVDEATIKPSIKTLAPKTQQDSSLNSELSQLLIIGDDRVNLPNQKLNHYVRIKSLLVEAGGRYRENGFDFSDRSATAVVAELILGNRVRAMHKEFAFFGTPRFWSERVVGILKCCQSPQAIIFEPHAGEGAIADEVRNRGIEPIVNELWSTNAKKLADKGYKPFELDFLDMNPSDIGGRVDAVVGNPPWGNRVDIQHFMHCLTFLKPGGEISMILSESALDNTHIKAVREFNDFLKRHDAIIERVPKNTFENTAVGGFHIYIDNYQASES
ncbi:hypothetical protein [Vibrio sp. 1180_3]|uniref:hypothetical protein n=1 Tax=Vibrio sp. 1180_3 TaxID=2528832 RepID=UPI00240595F8|nr:hypothetical protein [Vibrio sp. 1180_3]MDF9399169.1 hypothetical protein [Vibrio sp. 1180_3]